MWNLDRTTWDSTRVLYRYLDPHGAYLSLRNLTVKCSSPALFNDPFDTTTDVSIDFNAREFSDCLRKYLKALVFSEDEPGFQELTDIARLVIQLRKERDEFDLEGEIDYSSPQIQDAEKRLWEAIVRDRKRQEQFLLTWRICCLSDQYDNLLMWAHYADMHRGAVIGYRCVPELDSCFCVAGPILYQAEIPSLGTAEEWTRHLLGVERIDFVDRVMQMTMTKSSDWQYEREYRYMLPMEGDGNELYDLRLVDSQEIHSIYLGCRISPHDRERIMDIIQTHLSHVVVFQSTKSTKRFELEFEKL